MTATDDARVASADPVGFPRLHAIAPVTESSALIHIIERAARDPSVDIDKLERLISLKEKAEQRQAEQAFGEAMAAAQAEMKAVAADSNNPQTKSRYASYFALDKALRPTYTKHRFALSFDTGDSPQEQHVRVLCHVSNGGFTRTYHVDMPADGKGAKGGDVMTKTHAVGSAYAYGSRYLLKMIFNVAIGESDDDGNAAGAGPVLPDEQAEQITKLITETKTTLNLFLKWIGAPSVSDIPAAKAAGAIKMLEAKKAKME